MKSVARVWPRHGHRARPLNSIVRSHMERLEPLAPPPNWGADEVSNFLEIAQRNGFGSFVQLRAPFAKITAIDAFYRRFIENLNHTREWFAAFFVLRAHSAYLAACRLTVSGQIPESYMVQRGCLENAMYGFHIATRPELRETWLRRHDNEASKRAVKQEFQIGTIFERITLTNAQVAEVAKTLYDRTIDYGAHPNEQALMQVLDMERAAGDIRFEVRYLTRGEEPAFGACFKTTAQVGVCALDIFRLVFRERFQLLGLDRELDHLKRDL